MDQEIKAKIKVISYSGYRGEEKPKVLIFENKSIDVVKILRFWIEEDYGNRGRKRGFYVKGSDGLMYTIYYDENSMEWFYAI